jgi:hypothetical protein
MACGLCWFSTISFRIFLKIAGMTVTDFLGIPSLKEVVCTGATLTQEVNFLSLTLFRPPNKDVLASLVTPESTCNTYAEYASCTIDTGDRRKSFVKMLVADLEAGERSVLGCNVTSVNRSGHPKVYTWFVDVERKRKFFIDGNKIKLYDVGFIFFCA